MSKRTSTLRENYLSLDLEMNQPTDTIIQIGAVVGNIYTGEILEEYSQVVYTDEKLCTDPEICDIPKLTGITDERILKEGIPLGKAYEQLRDLHKKHNCMRNPIVWGGGDTKCLKEQVQKFYGRRFSAGYGDNDGEMFCFGHRWFDAKTLMQTVLLKHRQRIQGGLARSMLKVGLKFEGKKHDAMYDALNTFRIYCKLLETIDGSKLL